MIDRKNTDQNAMNMMDKIDAVAKIDIETNCPQDLEQPFPKGTRLHFIGIGGIGMSGIAKLYHQLGYHVQGSDMNTDSVMIQAMIKDGITIFNTHVANNIENADIIVYSSAIKDDNPELSHAKSLGKRIYQRIDALIEWLKHKKVVAISGSHGKTTTTSLVGHLLQDISNQNPKFKRPTIVSGGIMNNSGTNMILGDSDWVIVEADESDASFFKIPSDISIITNIDKEHLDFYGSFQKLVNHYDHFLQNYEGQVIYCLDDPILLRLMEKHDHIKALSYSILRKDADFFAGNYHVIDKQTHFDLQTISEDIDGVVSNMSGRHNLLNSLAAIAVCTELGADLHKTTRGLLDFQGVKRRFTHVDTVHGIDIIDDYAHHPTEIRHVLRAAHTMGYEKIHAVFQPHRFSRLKHLFDDFVNCFADADTVFISPVFAAGEQPCTHHNDQTLIDAINNGMNASNKSKSTLQALPYINNQDLCESLAKMGIEQGHLVIFLGAGTITKWAYDAPKILEHVLRSAALSNDVARPLSTSQPCTQETTTKPLDTTANAGT